MSALLGRKIGMTSIYTDAGEAVPCTVIEAGPCEVIQIKTQDKDGYAAVQLGFEDAEERKLGKPALGHFAKANVSPKRHLREFRNIVENLSQGDTLTVTAFAKGDKIKVSGTSKGKGFQGVVKRHHFSGVGSPTHGQSDRERAPGSIGSSSYPSRVFKGLRMAGRMGGRKTSVRNLEILQVIPESNLLLVKGSVPGAPNSLVEIVKL